MVQEEDRFIWAACGSVRPRRSREIGIYVRRSRCFVGRFGRDRGSGQKKNLGRDLPLRLSSGILAASVL